MMHEDKRHIEDTFPVKEVSEKSISERNTRENHIKMLHYWWARRPLAASRATAYAALTTAPTSENTEEWLKRRNFIINLSDWDNALSHPLIQQARSDILAANGGKPPKVLDPFSGGGSIPLEALRLGCETYSSDLNPVAVLIQKCTLEYPQKFGILPEEKEANMPKLRLCEDVNKWGRWVLEEAKKELDTFYPAEADGSFPTGYIWARTIPCPFCGLEIPLMRSFWLVNKPKTKAKTKVALYPKLENGRVTFKIVGDGYDPMPNGFLPQEGTCKGGVVPSCLDCGGTVPAKKTQQLFQEGIAGERMVAVVTRNPSGKKGHKCYRVATTDDEVIFNRAKKVLAEKQEQLKFEWGMDPVPDEPVPTGKGSKAERAFNIHNFGMKTWGDFFNARQKLALITFVEKVKAAFQQMMTEGIDDAYAKAVVSYLALILTRHSSYNTRLCWWDPDSQRCSNIFGQQTLSKVYDYAEQNTYGILTGNWLSQVENTTEVITHLSSTLFQQSACVIEASATKLPHPDEFFDAVFTDPPYYDNVPYSYLSDFFYVWLKRAVGDVYPELFLLTELTSQTNEVVAYSAVPAEFTDGNHYFETLLKKSFQEICRVLKTEGIAIIVYAHTSTEGWETLINSLLDSGLIMTGAWPLHTELTSRFRAKDSAALASSIYIVARKMVREETGYYNDVENEIEAHLKERLDPLWDEGMTGADFGIAAIGAALAIFGKYKEVIRRDDAKSVSAKTFLEIVRKLTCEYAIQKILDNGFADKISPETRFYILWRRDFRTKRVPFDDAFKLAQFCGVDLDQPSRRKNGFIVKEKKYIRLLGPQEREMDKLKGASEMIDVLHHVLLLWGTSQFTKIERVLMESKFAGNDAFDRVAQTIYETLSKGEEHQLLGGFLGGKGSEKIRESTGQLQQELFDV